MEKLLFEGLVKTKEVFHSFRWISGLTFCTIVDHLPLPNHFSLCQILSYTPGVVSSKFQNRCIHRLLINNFILFIFEVSLEIRVRLITARHRTTPQDTARHPQDTARYCKTPTRHRKGPQERRMQGYYRYSGVWWWWWGGGCKSEGSLPRIILLAECNQANPL